jgi:hypothetical protein
VLPIEVLHVTLAEIAHQSSARAVCRRSQQEVDVVCHQAVRMHCAVVLFGQLAQVRQVNEVVSVTSKTGRAVVAALNDVNRYTGQDQAQRSRHGR